MKKKINKIIFGTFLLVMVLVTTISVNALTIKESTDLNDNLDNITDGTVIMGITKFEPSIVVTALRASNATFNDVIFNYGTSGYKGVEIFYLLSGDWYKINEENIPSVVENAPLLTKLNSPDIFYINNNEKMIEIPFSNTLEAGFEFKFKSDNIEKDDKITLENGKIKVPATVKELVVIAKNKSTEDEEPVIYFEKDKISDAEFQAGVESTELANAKTAAKGVLTTVLSGYTVANYSAANWTALNTAKTNGDTEINNAATIVAVNAARDVAIAGMAAVKTKTEEAKAKAKEDIKVSYTVGKPTVELTTIDVITVGEGKLLYKVVVTPKYTDLSKAKASGRFVNTTFTVDKENVTVFYEFFDGTSMILKSADSMSSGPNIVGMNNHPLNSDNIEMPGVFYILVNKDNTDIEVTVKLLDSEWNDVEYGMQKIIANEDDLLVARVNASQLRITPENKAKETISDLLVNKFSLDKTGNQLIETVSLFWFNNYHYQNKFTFENKAAITTALTNTLTEYNKIISTFTGNGTGYATNVEAVESFLASAQRLADTSVPTGKVADEIEEVKDLYTAGIINSSNKVDEAYTTLINNILKDELTDELNKFLYKVQLALKP